MFQQHQITSKGGEVKCCRLLGVAQQDLNGPSENGVKKPLKDESTFCTIRKSGITHKQVQLCFLIAVVFSDLNSDNHSLLMCKRNRNSIVERKARRANYCSTSDESSEKKQSYSALLLAGRLHVKTWSVDNVNNVKHLQRVEKMS